MTKRAKVNFSDCFCRTIMGIARNGIQICASDILDSSDMRQAYKYDRRFVNYRGTSLLTRIIYFEMLIFIWRMINFFFNWDMNMVFNLCYLDRSAKKVLTN